MIVEKARVVAADEHYALVYTETSPACGRCAVNKGCGASVLSRLAGRRGARIRVANRGGAKVGDTVTLGMSEAGLLKSALIVYAVPLLGVVLAIALATAVTGARLSEAAGITVGVIGFALGLGVARRFSAGRVDNPDYHPVILSVEKPDQKEPASGGGGMLAP